MLSQHWGWQWPTDGWATDGADSVSSSGRHRGRSGAGRPDSERVGSGAAVAAVPAAALHRGLCTPSALPALCSLQTTCKWVQHNTVILQTCDEVLSLERLHFVVPIEQSQIFVPEMLKCSIK